MEQQESDNKNRPYERFSGQQPLSANYPHQAFNIYSRSPSPQPCSSSSSALSHVNQLHTSSATMPPLPPRNRQRPPPRTPPRQPRPSPQQVPPQLLAPWKLWDTVAVNISNLPKEATALDVWKALQKEGNIFSIDLFEDSHGKRDTKGKIRFK